MSNYDVEKVSGICMNSVHKDSSCHKDYFTIYHSGTKVGCFCLDANAGGRPALDSDTRVNTYKIESSDSGFAVESHVCSEFPLPAATPKILNMCSDYHKVAMEKFE